MEASKEEIQRLLDMTGKRGSVDNRRLFEIFNQLTGNRLRACYCAGKIDRIEQHLKNYIDENNGPE